MMLDLPTIAEWLDEFNPPGPGSVRQQPGCLCVPGPRSGFVWIDLTVDPAEPGRFGGLIRLTASGSSASVLIPNTPDGLDALDNGRTNRATLRVVEEAVRLLLPLAR